MAAAAQLAIMRPVVSWRAFDRTPLNTSPCSPASSELFQDLSQLQETWLAEGECSHSGATTARLLEGVCVCACEGSGGGKNE